MIGRRRKFQMYSHRHPCLGTLFQLFHTWSQRLGVSLLSPLSCIHIFAPDFNSFILPILKLVILFQVEFLNWILNQTPEQTLTFFERSRISASSLSLVAFASFATLVKFEHRWYRSSVSAWELLFVRIFRLKFPPSLTAFSSLLRPLLADFWNF